MTPEDFVLIGEWREEAPMRGAVILPVDRQGRLYLQFRDHGAPRYPGKWGLFGGVVEPDESLAEAAAREMEEETGVVVDGADLIPYARTISSETGAQNYTFLAHLDLRPVDISVREGGGFGAFTESDIAKLDLVPFVRLVVEHWFQARRARG